MGDLVGFEPFTGYTVRRQNKNILAMLRGCFIFLGRTLSKSFHLPNVVDKIEKSWNQLVEYIEHWSKRLPNLELGQNPQEKVSPLGS